MCTGFDKSAVIVLNVLSEEQSLTIEEIRKALGEARYTLFFGGGNSLERYIRSLVIEQYALFQDTLLAYRLTAKGIEKRERLISKMQRIA